MAGVNFIYMSKRVVVRKGDVFSIPLPDGHLGYAQALESPEFAFFDICTEDEVPAGEVVKNPVLFRLWVHKSGPRSWNKLGTQPLHSSLTKQIRRFNQDAISGRLYIYLDGKETPASYEEVKELERAAVWEAEHVMDRVQDYFCGSPCKWVESMGPKPKS